MKLIETQAYKQAMADALPGAKLFMHPYTDGDFAGLEGLIIRYSGMPLKEVLICTERDFSLIKRPIDSLWHTLTLSAQETTKILIWGLIDLSK